MSERYSDLEAHFGGPSDDAFGSAVFRRPIPAGGDIDGVALDVYRDFVGGLWDRSGAETWLGMWKEFASRDRSTGKGVLDLLQSLADPVTRSAADMMLNGGENPLASQAALVTAFDHPSVGRLKIYRIGDCEAMSGLIIAAYDSEIGQAVVLAFLMD